MPALAVWFVRFALLSLLAGTALGAAMLGLPGWRLPSRALHTELLLVGWLLQLALGVAYWILPKHAREPARGPSPPVVTAWILLNGGVWLTGLGLAVGAPAWIAVLGRTCELVAIVLAGTTLLPRIRPYGTQASPR